MTLDFQKNILRYLFQHKIEYLEFLEPAIFDVIELKALFELYHNYVRKYKTLPDRGNFNEYLEQQEQLTPAAKNFIRNAYVWLYEELIDISMVEDRILEEVKKKMFRDVLMDAMKTIDEGIKSETITDFHSRIAKINDLKQASNDPGLHLLKDLNKVFTTTDIVYPTFLKGLNSLTALGGFYPPQLILLMGPPKSYKTGLMIKLALGYMKDGLNVFYADFENGQQIIMDRFKQGLLECNIKEIGKFNSELNQIKDKLLNFTGSGGDIFIKRYAKQHDHIGTIENDIMRECDAGDAPKVIFYDYIDIMGCSDKSKKTIRERIQKNYADADNVNTKYDTFSFTVSKMKQSATFKEKSDMTDVGEDFEKMYNAHASFALNRTEEDLQLGTARLNAIAQRQGSSFQDMAVFLKIDPVNSIIKELEE